MSGVDETSCYFPERLRILPIVDTSIVRNIPQEVSEQAPRAATTGYAFVVDDTDGSLKLMHFCADCDKGVMTRGNGICIVDALWKSVDQSRHIVLGNLEIQDMECHVQKLRLCGQVGHKRVREWDRVSS